MKDDINEIRKRINIIDEQLMRLFVERMNCCKQIAIYKKENNLPILDVNREKEVLEINLSKLDDNNLKEYYKEFLIALMNISKSYQKNQK